jgi:radical SAM superfamily enzyme YgiQ (UPF0313 family)
VLRERDQGDEHERRDDRRAHRGMSTLRIATNALYESCAMSVQFSRGCPFDCEFCDIVVTNGRVPRTKSPHQLVAELEALRLAGWRDVVFIVDDNFTGNRKQAMELLRAIERL